MRCWRFDPVKFGNRRNRSDRHSAHVIHTRWTPLGKASSPVWTDSDPDRPRPTAIRTGQGRSPDSRSERVLCALVAWSNRPRDVPCADDRPCGRHSTAGQLLGGLRQTHAGAETILYSDGECCGEQDSRNPEHDRSIRSCHRYLNVSPSDDRPQSEPDATAHHDRFEPHETVRHPRPRRRESRLRDWPTVEIHRPPNEEAAKDHRHGEPNGTRPFTPRTPTTVTAVTSWSWTMTMPITKTRQITRIRVSSLLQDTPCQAVAASPCPD